jgi:hypothetical protein
MQSYTECIVITIIYSSTVCTILDISLCSIVLTYLHSVVSMVTSVLHPLIILFLSLQPKQIHEIKDFRQTARRKDAPSVKIKRSKDVM